jgi:hypothetical protein
MVNEREPSWPPQLVLAQRWAVALSRETRSANLVGPDGRAEIVLLVAHGPRDLTVRATGTCITVSLAVEFAKEVRDTFGGLPRSAQLRALRAVRTRLFQQPRTSFSIDPPGAVSIVQVTRVVVEQTFRISEDDPSSFNRFAEGLQEVTAAAVGGFARLGAFMGGGSNDRPGPREPAPAGMYA